MSRLRGPQVRLTDTQVPSATASATEVWGWPAGGNAATAHVNQLRDTWSHTAPRPQAGGRGPRLGGDRQQMTGIKSYVVNRRQGDVHGQRWSPGAPPALHPQ